MNFLKKLAAIIVIILSIIGIVLCVGGIYGAWAVNEPVTQGVVSAMGTADQFLGVAESTSSLAAVTVGDVSTRLAEIEAAASSMTPEQQAALATRIEELIRPVQSASSVALAAEAGITALDQTITSVSRLPGIQIAPPPEKLTTAGNLLGQVGERLDALYTALSAREPDGERVAAITGETSAQLTQLTTQLQELNAGVAQAQQAAATVQAQAPQILDMASIALTLILILMAAGQVSLLVHAWGWFRD